MRKYQTFNLKKLLEVLSQDDKFYSSIDLALVLGISPNTARSWLSKLAKFWETANFLVHGYVITINSKGKRLSIKVQPKFE